MKKSLVSRSGELRCCRNRQQKKRAGATLVETAFVLPIFFLFVFALFEFGHALMVVNYLTSVAKQTAYQASFEGVSTAEAELYANERLGAILGSGNARTYVRNGSAYEASNSGSVTPSSLPAVELNELESRDLFLVQVEVPYDSVTLLSPFWIKDTTLTGVSIMRRE